MHAVTVTVATPLLVFVTVHPHAAGWLLSAEYPVAVSLALSHSLLRSWSERRLQPGVRSGLQRFMGRSSDSNFTMLPLA